MVPVSGLMTLVSFVDFALQSGSTCESDYVQVLDGASGTTNDTRIGRWCDVHAMAGLPSSIQSNAHGLSLIHHSDGDISARGWRANFTSGQFRKAVLHTTTVNPHLEKCLYCRHIT